MAVSQVLRAATWNIEHGRRWDTGEVDPDALATACADLAADVLALQEVERWTRRVGGADLLAVVADATGLTPIDGHVLRHGDGTYGNALLVRPALLDVDAPGPLRLHRPGLPPWGRPEPRGAIRARLLFGAEPLGEATQQARGVFRPSQTAGTNLRHARRDLSAQAPRGVTVVAAHLGLRRRERARQLDGLLRAAGGGAAVVLGDLNAFPPEVEPHALRHGFTPVDVPPAFPASAPRCVIDHVLARGVAVRPLPDAGRPVISDHRPVVVEIAELALGAT